MDMLSFFVMQETTNVLIRKHSPDHIPKTFGRKRLSRGRKKILTANKITLICKFLDHVIKNPHGYMHKGEEKVNRKLMRRKLLTYMNANKGTRTFRLVSDSDLKSWLDSGVFKTELKMIEEIRVLRDDSQGFAACSQLCELCQLDIALCQHSQEAQSGNGGKADVDMLSDAMQSLHCTSLQFKMDQNDADLISVPIVMNSSAQTGFSFQTEPLDLSMKPAPGLDEDTEGPGADKHSISTSRFPGKPATRRIRDWIVEQTVAESSEQKDQGRSRNPQTKLETKETPEAMSDFGIENVLCAPSVDKVSKESEFVEISGKIARHAVSTVLPPLLLKK